MAPTPSFGRPCKLCSITEKAHTPPSNNTNRGSQAGARNVLPLQDPEFGFIPASGGSAVVAQPHNTVSNCNKARLVRKDFIDCVAAPIQCTDVFSPRCTFVCFCCCGWTVLSHERIPQQQLILVKCWVVGQYDIALHLLAIRHWVFKN